MAEHHIIAYLITLALGYWVLTLAGKEQKTSKTIGQLIGWAIIIVSLCGALCMGVCKVMACHSMAGSCDTSVGCPYSGSKMACPDTKGMDGMKGMDKKAEPPAAAAKKPAAK